MNIVNYALIIFRGLRLKNLSLPIPNFADWIKKRESLIELFIDELNPISSSTARTAAKSSGNFDVLHERMLYSKTLSEKSDEEIVALVVKQRKEAALEFQRSIEQSLEQLSRISSEFKPSSQIRRKMPL